LDEEELAYIEELLGTADDPLWIDELDANGNAQASGSDNESV
jgi:hypothetical protein